MVVGVTDVTRCWNLKTLMRKISRSITPICSIDGYMIDLHPFFTLFFYSQVVVLSTRIVPIMPQRSTSEVSFISSNAERKAHGSSKRSSLIGWDTSLEDVQVEWRQLLPQDIFFFFLLNKLITR